MKITKKLYLLCVALLCSMIFLNSCALFHEHKFSEWEITKEATCTANGEKKKACKCGEAEIKIIKATGHVPGAEATCTSAQFCTVCNKKLVSTLGHQAGAEATCTTAQICTVCNEELVSALGHQAGAEATCTTAQICTVCNEELVGALGHQAGAEATCTTAQICTVCNEELASALGHQAGTKVTCTTAQICAVCNEKLASALGHQAGAKATCTTAQICTVCNEELVGALGHQAGAEATCTTAQICMVCNEELVSAFGHQEMIDASVDPTCDSIGLTEGAHCERCLTVLVAQREIPSLGHLYNEGEVITEATCMQLGVKKFTCSIVSCGHSYTESYALSTYGVTEILSASAQYTGKITAYDPNGTERSFGTGVLLSSDGKIITNYHVIEGAYSADITINNVKYPIISVLACDAKRDLAILKISAADLISAPICKKPVGIGETVYAVGFSQGLTITYSKGIVIDGKRTLNGFSYVQHDASLMKGFLGGPLINAYGEVVGIHAQRIDNSQNLDFSILVEELGRIEYGTPSTLRELYERKIRAYREELESLTSEYNKNVSELQTEIAVCQTNIETCRQMIDHAKMQLRDLSPDCPQWFIQQYINQWQLYGSTVTAEQAARSEWTQEYDSQRSLLNQTISMNQTALEGYQADLSRYESQMDDFNVKYSEAVKALQAKYAIEE